MSDQLLTDRERAIYTAGFNAGVAKTLGEVGGSLKAFASQCEQRATEHSHCTGVPTPTRGTRWGAMVGRGIKGWKSSR